MTLLPDSEVLRLDPLGSFNLDALVSGAMRLRSDRDAIGDGATGEAVPLSFAEFDRRVGALAGFLLDLGLKPGERLLVAGGAATTSVVASIAALRAGLDVALAPLHLSGDDMLDFARASEAVALFADAAYGELAPAEEMLGVAAQAPQVRFVGSLGGHVDGAVDADPEKLAVFALGNAAEQTGETHILTRAEDGEVVVHRQRTLVAAALDLVTRAHFGMRLPIVTTIAPVTFAGLVAGPVAALLAGAPLFLHGPFATAGFTSLLERIRPAHLVAPAAMLPALRHAGLLTAETLASLVLISRCSEIGASPGDEQAPGLGESKSPPIVDLFAIGEHAAVPEVRGRERAHALSLVGPHESAANDRRVFAGGRDAASALEGAVVTGGRPKVDERA